MDRTYSLNLKEKKNIDQFSHGTEGHKQNNINKVKMIINSK